MSRIGVGVRGERVALERLTREGYRLVERNFRTKWGEIDLIMRDKKTLVFVEVKAKTGEEFGTPEQMVGTKKLRQVVRIGEMYSDREVWEGGVRVDVVAIVFDKIGKVERYNHYENVTEL